MYIVCCIILAAYGWTTVRNEIKVQIYSGLKFGDAAKNNVKKGDDNSAVAYVTKICSRSFRLLIRVVIYQIVHIDK